MLSRIAVTQQLQLFQALITWNNSTQKNMQKYKRQKLLWEEKRSRLRALRVYFLFKKKLYRSWIWRFSSIKQTEWLIQNKAFSLHKHCFIKLFLGTDAADGEFTTGRGMLEPPGSPQIREPRRVPAHYRRFDYLKSIKEICVRSITAVIQYSS